MAEQKRKPPKLGPKKTTPSTPAPTNKAPATAAQSKAPSTSKSTTKASEASTKPNPTSTPNQQTTAKPKPTSKTPVTSQPKPGPIQSKKAGQPPKKPTAAPQAKKVEETPKKRPGPAPQIKKPQSTSQQASKPNAQKPAAPADQKKPSSLARKASTPGATSATESKAKPSSRAPSESPAPSQSRRPSQPPRKASSTTSVEPEGSSNDAQYRRPSQQSRKPSKPSVKIDTAGDNKLEQVPEEAAEGASDATVPPRRPSATARKHSAPAINPQNAGQKRKPRKLPPKAPQSEYSTTSTRRPSITPRADSPSTVKSSGVNDEEQRQRREEQDLKSLLDEDQRTDLSQLVASITRQMRKTIEDNFDASATLQTLGQDRKEMSEDEKIMSADFDTGAVDVSVYEKERKLKYEREKELSAPKLKELKRTALEWFDEWKEIVQKRVDETVEPRPDAARDEKDPKGPSFAQQTPIQKVDTGSKKYTPPKLEELFPRIPTSLTKLPMQKRVLVLHSILLLMLSLEHYNAASRVLLLYLTSSLKLGLKYLREDEETTAQGLLQAAKQISHDEEALKKKKEESKEAHKWRVRLATAAGAGVVGVAGGLAAPMIAAGVGTVMSGIGLEATTAASYLGSVASSTYLVGGLFGAYGGRMTGDMMEELSAEVEDFAFLPVHGERKVHSDSVDAATESRRLRVVVAISGWLLEKEEVVTPWRVLKPSAEVFALRFELEALMNLGQSIDTMISSAAYGYAQSAMIQRTVFAELMSAMWPVALVKVARVVDNPFTLAKTRADKAGKVLAEALINRTQGERPVTLVGYSLGARVIWSCLTTLSERKAFGLVESAVLMGSPLPSDTSTWRKMRTAVSGRLINVYSENDYLLAFLYRTSSLQYGVAGLMPVSGLYGVENVDVSETVSGHLRYRYLVGSVLQKIGFEDIDKTEVDKEAEAFKKVVEEESKHGYIEQAKQGYKGNKSGKPPKPKVPSDADADKQASAMEKQIQEKTKKGLMQWAVEQLYISQPSVPSTGDVKNAATDPQAAAKGATKTVNKTADAATKSLYQRAKEAVYLSRSGGLEGQNVGQNKLSEAQTAASSSYLSSAAGYIPTSYIPGLSGATSTPKKDTAQPGKPALKKTTSAQKAVGDTEKPALKKTDSVQKKVGDAAKDPSKAASSAQKTVTDTAKDPSKAATETQKQVADASKTATDTATTAGKNVGETATDPTKVAEDGQKQVADSAKRAGGVASYLPSFGLGGSSKNETSTASKRTSSTPSKQAAQDTEKPAKESSTAAEKATGDVQKKLGEASDNAQTKSSGYGSYIPHFGFGGSKAKLQTPDKKKSTNKGEPKTEETAKDVTKKTEEASEGAQDAASKGTGLGQATASDVASKAKDSGEDIFTSPPSKAGNNAFTSAASSASSAGNSASKAASGAGQTVTDGAKGAGKYTPSMGGVGGDNGSKVGDMAGGAVSGSTSGASFLGKGFDGAAQLASAGKQQQEKAARNASGKTSDQDDKAEKEDEEGNDEQNTEESDETPDKDAKPDPSKREEEDPSNEHGTPDPSTKAPDSDSEGSEASSQTTEKPIEAHAPSNEEGEQGQEEGDTQSSYSSAIEDPTRDDEDDSHQKPSDDTEAKNVDQDQPLQEVDPKPQQSEEEGKGYLGSVGSGAASAGSAAGNAATGAVGGVASGVGKLGKGFEGWGM